MGPADPDRSGHPAAATAGTLDSGEQAAEATGQTQGQAEGTAGQAESGPAGARSSRLRAAVPRPRQAVTGTSGMRRVLRSPVARHIGILLCFIAAGVLATLPLAANLAGRIPAARDPASYVWDFWWVAHQVTHLGNPWFTPLMAAPVGVQLGFHTMMPLPGVLFTPVTLAFGPAFSYNLWTVILPGLLCYATYRAARLWLRSATGAVGAAVFFGLSTMLTQQDWYHLNIALGAMFLPMALEASVRLRRTPGRRQAIILGLVMGAAVLSDQESAVLAAIVVGLVLLPWLLRRPGWARLWPVLLACVAGTVVASPQIIAMLQEIIASHGGLSIDPKLLAVSYKQYGIGLPGDVHPDAAGDHLRARPPGRPLPARPGQRGHADVRHHADRARAARPDRELAAPVRVAARRAVDRVRRARPGHLAVDRQAPVPAAVLGVERGPGVRPDALHLVRPAAGPVQLP